jgi:hypothetical protein
VARETLADLREQQRNAIARAERAERELIHLKALISLIRGAVAEAERVTNG